VYFEYLFIHSISELKAGLAKEGQHLGSVWLHDIQCFSVFFACFWSNTELNQGSAFG